MNSSALPRLMFFVLAAILFTTLLLRPIHDVDIFWQLKLGELTVQQRAIPQTEPFLATRLAEPFVPVAWLGQVVYSFIYSIGNWRLLHFTDTAIWFAGFLIVARSVKVNSQMGIVLGLLAGFLAASPFQSIRPQSFAVLAFGLLIILVRSNHAFKWKIALGIPLLILWQNLHPSVIVGAIYLVAVTMAGLVRTVFRREAKPWTEAILMLSAGMAMFATPAGPALLKISRVNGALSQWMQIGEWLPMWDSQNRAAAVGPFFAIVLLIYLSIRYRDRITLRDLFPAIVFAVMSLIAFRFVVFFGITLIPIIAQSLTPNDQPVPHGNSSSRRSHFTAALFTVVILVLSYAVMPVRFAEYYPFAGIEELKKANVHGTIYCHHSWGSLLPFYDSENWHPTHDGRYYLHTKSEWEFYFDAAQGRHDVLELEILFRPAAFFLRPGNDQGLIDQLAASPRWQLHFNDSSSVIYLPR